MHAKRQQVFVGGCCWPDPDPAPHRPPRADDVTRFDATVCERIVYPRCVQDVQRLFAEARAANCKIAMRGTQHSMGGQCVGGSLEGKTYVLDFSCLDFIGYDCEKELVVCGPGATWADLIVHLNEYGKSPRTMQSYSTFSVGGTLAVNGHGVTTDHCVSESVVAMEIVLADGTQV